MNQPSFREAFNFWLKLGFISFGGPAGQIAIMHRFLVEQKKWISDSRFMHALNYCMLLPGPEAQQLATYIGWLLHGTRGGLAAGILFVLPSMLILLALSVAYVTYGSIPWVNAMFNGLKPAVIAIVILALIKISKKSLSGWQHYSMAAAAFIGIFFLNIPFPLIVLSAIVIGLIAHWLKRESASQSGTSNRAFRKEEETQFLINSSNITGDMGFRPLRFTGQLLTAVVLWFLPLSVFFLCETNFGFWKNLSLFFTQAAFVTFGGAYAVLPYVAQVSVEKFRWLTEMQMIDGLALGETTPGPLIMVLAFVGFMAGYNYGGQSLLTGGLGLITTTYYTFLPCFLFIFAGAPIIESTQQNKTVRSILTMVTAAVVGVILNLTIYLGKAVIVSAETGVNYFSAAWIAVSVLMLYKFSANMIVWIVVSAFYGLVLYLCGLH